MRNVAATLFVSAFVAAACAPAGDGSAEPGEGVALGPVDGRELPGTDIERVGVDDVAPDFTLASLGGLPVTLSSFRGAKDVVLVFYRGHW